MYRVGVRTGRAPCVEALVPSVQGLEEGVYIGTRSLGDRASVATCVADRVRTPGAISFKVLGIKVDS